MVAMDHKRVVFPVQNKFEDGGHGGGRNGFFLRPLHVEDGLLDAIGGDKRLKLVIGLISLDQGAKMGLVLRVSDMDRCQHIHYRLQLQILQEGVVFLLRIAASVNTRNNQAKVDWSTIHGRCRELCDVCCSN